MIRVVLRLDDPSETSSQEVEAGFMRALDRHKACATFAVIPFHASNGTPHPLSAARAKPLVEAAHLGLIDIALHGHSHTRLTNESASPSEFSGRPDSEQELLITEGRAYLEDLFCQRIAGFVPPWNNYDVGTLRVLSAHSFQYISAGWNCADGDTASIVQLPFTTRLDRIDAALDEAHRFVSFNPIIIFIAHHYDFVESGSSRATIDLPRFERILATLAATPDLRFCTLSAVANHLKPSCRPLRQRRLWVQYPRLRRYLPEHSIIDGELLPVVCVKALKTLWRDAPRSVQSNWRR
jgi:hypothetical protein